MEDPSVCGAILCMTTMLQFIFNYVQFHRSNTRVFIHYLRKPSAPTDTDSTRGESKVVFRTFSRAARQRIKRQDYPFSRGTNTAGISVSDTMVIWPSQPDHVFYSMHMLLVCGCGGLSSARVGPADRLTSIMRKPAVKSRSNKPPLPTTCQVCQAEDADRTRHRSCADETLLTQGDAADGGEAKPHGDYR